MSAASPTFRVAFTGDFFAADGSTKYPDIGLSVFADRTRTFAISRFAEHRATIGADQIDDAQGVIVLTPRVTAESVSHGPRPAGDRPVRRGL